MNAIEGLKFLLVLWNLPQQRSSLTEKLFGKTRTQLCQALGADQLVDFSRTITSLQLATAGQALLERIQSTLPIAPAEFQVLQALVTIGKVAPTGLKIAAMTAGERNQVLQRLSDRGLIAMEVTKTTKTGKTSAMTVQITPAGHALLQLALAEMPLPQAHLELLQAIAIHTIAPGKLTTPAKLKSRLTATQRDQTLQEFLAKGWIEAETTLKTVKPEVWLTDRGRECLASVGDHFQTVRSLDGMTPAIASPPEKRVERPGDEEILQTIQRLDRQLGTRNDLPIFHLRQTLQPPLSREELDQALYRLQRRDRVELGTLVHAQNYTPEQVSAGIQQRSGSPLFFIKVTV
jgi:DNA-binding PadR family transcriptional regulator